MPTITALGDSTTWGYNSGSQVQNNMVTTAQEELSKKLGTPVEIINRGQNSTTLGDAIANGNLYAAASDPSNVVVLNFGMNEAYRRVNPEEFKQNILDAAGYLISQGKTVVLQTPNYTSNPDIPNVDQYANVVRDVAGQYGLTLDDKYAATENAEFSPNDLTHPTAQVYQSLGKSLANALAPIVTQQPQQQVQSTSVSEPGMLSNPQPIPEELYYNPQNEREAGGTAVSNVPGRTVYAPTQQELQNTLANISSTASQEAMQSYGPNTLENALTTAIVGAITGGLLGPAGLGLSQPVAAGIGGAAGTAATGADRNQILLGALLAGGSAYGLGELSSALNQSAYDLSFAAADAAQLANQGLDAAAIAQNLSTYVDPTVANSLANTARNAFLTLPEGIEGVSPSDVVADLKFQPTRGTSTQLPTLPDSVEVPGQRIPGNLFDITPSSVGGLLYDLLELRGTSSPIPGASTQQVQVQDKGLPQTQTTAQELISAVAPAAVSAVPTSTGGTQQVEVPGTRTVKTNENIISSIVPALTTATIPAAAQAVTQPTGTQQVEVSTTRDKSLLPYIAPPVIAAIPALPAGLTAELPKPLEPTQKADEKSLFKPSDILKIIGLLGGAGAGAALSNMGTGTVSTPPSDMMLGSTTPQFGPDYYAAVQRYYNAYMPETPRNVATPLQQWYENKFGA